MWLKTDDEKAKYLGHKSLNDLPKPIKRSQRGLSNQQNFYSPSRPVFYQYSADTNISLPSSVGNRTVIILSVKLSL